MSTIPSAWQISTNRCRVSDMSDIRTRTVQTSVNQVWAAMKSKPGAVDALEKLLYLLEVTQGLSRVPRDGKSLSEFDVAFSYWFQYDLTDSERLLVEDWLASLEDLSDDDRMDWNWQTK